MEIKGSAYKKIAEILMEVRRMSGSARAYKLRRAEQKKAQRELANRQRTQAAKERLDAVPTGRELANRQRTQAAKERLDAVLSGKDVGPEASRGSAPTRKAVKKPPNPEDIGGKRKRVTAQRAAQDSRMKDYLQRGQPRPVHGGRSGGTLGAPKKSIFTTGAMQTHGGDTQTKVPFGGDTQTKVPFGGDTQTKVPFGGGQQRVDPKSAEEIKGEEDEEAQEKEQRADDMQTDTDNPEVQQSLDVERRQKERDRGDQGFEEYKKKSVSPEEVRALGGSEEEASKYKGPYYDPRLRRRVDDPGPGRYPVKGEDPSKPTRPTGRAKDWLFSRLTTPFTAGSPSLMQRFLGGHNPNHPDNLERQERLQARMKTRHSDRQHKVPKPAPNWQYAAMRKIPGLRTLGRAGEKFIRRGLHTAQPWRREKGVFDKPYRLHAKEKLGNLRKFLGGRNRTTERSINGSYGKLVVEIQKRYQNHYNKKEK